MFATGLKRASRLGRVSSLTPKPGSSHSYRSLSSTTRKKSPAKSATAPGTPPAAENKTAGKQSVSKVIKLKSPDNQELSLAPTPTERYFVVGSADCPHFEAVRTQYETLLHSSRDFPDIHVHFSAYAPVTFDTRRLEVLSALSYPQHAHKCSPISFICNTRVIPSDLDVHTNGIDRVVKPTLLIGDGKDFIEHMKQRFTGKYKDATSVVQTQLAKLSNHVGPFPLNQSAIFLNTGFKENMYQTLPVTHLQAMSTSFSGTPFYSHGYNPSLPPSRSSLAPHPFYKKPNQWANLVKKKYAKQLDKIPSPDNIREFWYI